MPPMLGAVAVLSFVVAFGALRLLLSRFGRFALDQPNERSLHQNPVPRTGGIAVLAGAAVSFAFGAAQLWLPLALAGALAVLSFADDVRGLPTLARLGAHLAAAVLLVWYVLSPMDVVEMVLLILAVAWITNLYNFMDGSDGLAGGMAAIGFAAYGMAAWWGGDAELAALCVALSSAAVAFLLHNHHPARIFLGDVGSIPLGFLAAALGIVGWRNDQWPLWFPVLVFGPFIGDATLTLVQRLLRRERVWQAHRDHYYQRMVRMGLGHRGTAWAAYAVMLVCALAALAGRDREPMLQAAAFFGTSALLAVLAIWVDLRWRRFMREQKPA
jgi:UDP-N-acetylmuramyl pentapeptide phosphotransferase/UDP-N-acetylglucosamine-1-phosphate transferase